MKRVLVAGGSKHGQWLEVVDTAYTFKVPKPYTSPLLTYADETPLDTPSYEVYWIERVPIEFQGLRALVEVAVSEDILPEDRPMVTIRAIFQRDIADLFTKDGWDLWD